jgi:hypothetical protein
VGFNFHPEWITYHLQIVGVVKDTIARLAVVGPMAKCGHVRVGSCLGREGTSASVAIIRLGPVIHGIHVLVASCLAILHMFVSANEYLEVVERKTTYSFDSRIRECKSGTRFEDIHDLDSRSSGL